MPRAKISDAHGITVELEAGEASYTDLGNKALELLAKATAIVDQRPTGPASGGQIERRGTPDHRNPNARSNLGFAPVKADHNDDYPGLGNSEP